MFDLACAFCAREVDCFARGTEKDEAVDARAGEVEGVCGLGVKVERRDGSGLFRVKEGGDGDVDSATRRERVGGCHCGLRALNDYVTGDINDGFTGDLNPNCGTVTEKGTIAIYTIAGVRLDVGGALRGRGLGLGSLADRVRSHVCRMR